MAADTRTLHWPVPPPAVLSAATAGRKGREAPVLWFRACRGRAVAAPLHRIRGVLGAAGIVDAAQVGVRARPLSRQVQLRMSIDPALWDQSADPVLPESQTRADRLTVTVSGSLRPLELQALEPWQ